MPPPGPTSQRPPSSRRADWSRALESIVHGGMVVGMVTFIILDLVSFMGAGPLGWLAVGTGLVSAVLVVATMRIPLTGLFVVVALSLTVTLSIAILGVGAGAPQLTGFGEVAAISILASEVARRLPAYRVTLGLGAAVVATGANAALRSPDYLALVAFFWLILTLAVVMGLALRWTERSRQMSEDVARREERLSIARELHDSVAHHVTGIVVQAQAARAVGRSNPEAVEEALASIEQSGLATMTAMRRLVGALRSDDGEEPLAPTAGLEGLADLVETSVAGGTYDVTLDMEADDAPASFGPSIYRIVQESLTNVRRHGIDVTKVEVTVRMHDDGVRVSVVDDGRHSERPPARGFGLSGMAERVAALGGQFWAGARPGSGWAVTAWIPIGR